MQPWLVTVLLASCLALPAPQSDDYGDYDESSLDVSTETPPNGLEEILKLGTQLTQGILELLSNKHLQNTVHLRCDLECQDMEESQAKTECEEQYCAELAEEDDYSI